jgi:hypothetical protein
MTVQAHATGQAAEPGKLIGPGGQPHSGPRKSSRYRDNEVIRHDVRSEL